MKTRLIETKGELRIGDIVEVRLLSSSDFKFRVVYLNDIKVYLGSTDNSDASPLRLDFYENQNTMIEIVEKARITFDNLKSGDQIKDGRGRFFLVIDSIASVLIVEPQYSGLNPDQYAPLILRKDELRERGYYVIDRDI